MRRIIVVAHDVNGCLNMYVCMWQESKPDDTAAQAAARSNVYKASKFPSCERNGVDQGIHNVLVHSNLIPNMKIWSQADGPVANMQAKVAIIRVPNKSHCIEICFPILE